MFNHNFSSKRAKLALRFFTYGVMTVASVVLTVLLVLVALGYRLDKDLTFSQGGLVQFRSVPASAAVTIDGKKQDFNTPNKANLAAGEHSFSMELNGYRPWTKTTTLERGQLLWLNYARMIPNSITTNTLQEYPSVTRTLPSPDRRWLMMQMGANSPEYVLVDYSDEKKPQYTPLQLPAELFTKKDGKYGSFTLVEWDLQSKYVLVRHDNDGIVEYARIDRSKPADAVNLTKLFSLDIAQAHFSGSNANTLFARTGDVLRKLDVNGPTASGPLVAGVRDFAVYGEDTIAFTNVLEKNTGDQASREQMVGVYKGGKVSQVREFGADAKIKIAYSEYDNHSYLAITDLATSKIEIVRDATATGASKQATFFAEFDLGNTVDYLSFSSNGRMAVAQHGNTFATYDIETSKSYRTTLSFGSDKTGELKWLDDYYLYSDDGDKLRIFEFDGTNQHEITSVAAGREVMLSANGKQLLSIGKNATTGASLLQTSRLSLEN